MLYGYPANIDPLPKMLKYEVDSITSQFVTFNDLDLSCLFGAIRPGLPPIEHRHCLPGTSSTLSDTHFPCRPFRNPRRCTITRRKPSATPGVILIACTYQLSLCSRHRDVESPVFRQETHFSLRIASNETQDDRLLTPSDCSTIYREG
jgi:hypothetical protein